MPKGRERGTACAIPQSSRRKPSSGTGTALAVDAAVTSRAGRGASLNDASSPSSPDDALRALLVTLRQQSDLIAAIEEEGHHLPERITDASRNQERRLKQALERRCETLDGIITTVAATPAGLCVKAEALRLVALGDAFSQAGATLEESAHYVGGWGSLALSLARDVLVWSAAA